MVTEQTGWELSMVDTLASFADLVKSPSPYKLIMVKNKIIDYKTLSS